MGGATQQRQRLAFGFLADCFLNSGLDSNPRAVRKSVRAALASLAILPLTFFITGSAMAEQLSIAAGERYTVTEPKQTLEQLVIGDNATLVFVPGVQQWSLVAKRARIGNNVTIDGRGQAGQAGKSGANAASEAAEQCHEGEPGANATVGANGAAGVSISLRLGLQQLGSLTVDSTGGAGGAGGVGGSGQHGGAINRCRGSDGGAGGAGGLGGDGGDGGNVKVTFWDPAAKQDLQAYTNQISVTAIGGAAGAGGQGGRGGGAVDGEYQKGFSPGGKKWLAGGDAGAEGAAGREGRAGRSGQVNVDEDLRLRITLMQGAPVAAVVAASAAKPAATGPAASEPAVQAQLDKLNKLVQDLQKRLDVLEKQ